MAVRRVAESRSAFRHASEVHGAGGMEERVFERPGRMAGFSADDVSMNPTLRGRDVRAP